MKKITLLLFALCAFTLVGNAQVMGTSSPGAAIPDNTPDPGGLVDTITIGATSGTVTDVVVDVQITHTWAGDLILTLESPGGAASTTLMVRPGVPATTFGCSGDDIDTTFSDAGAVTTESVCLDLPAIDAGPYLAQSDDAGTSVSLAATFAGVNATGDWTLTVTDNASGDTGTLDSWTITISGPTLGVEDNALQAFEYYPNPVKDNFTVNAANTIDAISVYNLLGQEVMKTSPNALTTNMNMSELQTGAYFVKISSGDITETIRIVKQ